MLRIAERERYEFSNYKGNLKKSWILLKEVINRNKTRDCSSKFLLNGECITDKLKIANGFNYYFINVGPNLANNIPDTIISPLNNMNERNALDDYRNGNNFTNKTFKKWKFGLWFDLGDHSSENSDCVYNTTYAYYEFISIVWYIPTRTKNCQSHSPIQIRWRYAFQ